MVRSNLSSEDRIVSGLEFAIVHFSLTAETGEVATVETHSGVPPKLSTELESIVKE